MNRSTYTMAGLAVALLAGQATAMISGDNAVDVSPEEWIQIMDSPNATNTIHVPGYNISRSYDDDDGISVNWTMSLKVVADIPVPNSDNEFFTATEIRIHPPESMTMRNGSADPADDSWLHCETYLFTVEMGGADDEINPRCEGVVSDDCLDALKDIALTNSCATSPARPEACEGDVSRGLGAATWGPISPQTEFYYQYESPEEPHEQGGTDAYDKAIREVTVMILGFAQTNQTEEDSPYKSGMEPNSQLRGGLSCIRAQDFSEGSRTFSAAPTTAVSASLMVGALALMALMLA